MLPLSVVRGLAELGLSCSLPCAPVRLCTRVEEFGSRFAWLKYEQLISSIGGDASDKKINPPVAGVRSLIEPVARSEAAPGTLPGLKPERQDERGGPIRACRESATGVAANHALDARSGSSAGALVALRRCRKSGDRSAAGWHAGASSRHRAVDFARWRAAPTIPGAREGLALKQPISSAAQRA